MSDRTGGIVPETSNKYLIVSIKFRLWILPQDYGHPTGYTTSFAYAGRFNYEEAMKIIGHYEITELLPVREQDIMSLFSPSLTKRGDDE